MKTVKTVERKTTEHAVEPMEDLENFDISPDTHLVEKFTMSAKKKGKAIY